MFDPKHFEELAKKFCATLPTSLQNFEQEIQQKFKAILEATFTNLNLVTRDDFDVQTKVLIRTRQKLELLETRVQQLLEQQQDGAQHNKIDDSEQKMAEQKKTKNSKKPKID